jgi:hypothetical protein
METEGLLPHSQEHPILHQNNVKCCSPVAALYLEGRGFKSSAWRLAILSSYGSPQSIQANAGIVP